MITALLMLVGAVASDAQGVILQSDITNGIWGEWGNIARCPTNQFVYGYRLLSEASQGENSDDTALNGIDLMCALPEQSYGDRQSFSDIHSSRGPWGTWSRRTYCSGPINPVVGFRMRIESKQGSGDDTAANDVHLYCKNGGSISAPEQTDWGQLTEVLRCPIGQAVVGIQTRVEGKQGESDDDTALNGIKMLCDREQVNGNWGGWGGYGACSTDCGPGVQRRTRSCNNPAPSNGGTSCSGSSDQTKPCNDQAMCPGKGWCETSKCRDQNSGTIPLVAHNRDDCLAACRKQKNAKGCEWSSENCVAHTQDIAYASGSAGYDCWVFSKC